MGCSEGQIIFTITAFPPFGDAAKFKQYLDGGGGVEHVLQTEVAAAVQVVLAEVLYEL